MFLIQSEDIICPTIKIYENTDFYQCLQLKDIYIFLIIKYRL